ncbi:hypothetical protein DBV23_13465 [Edwardsiella ictaluri]|uniref:Uncharacterized protein n=2 Tax=Edwardsiella ictaluri TaxID=67780 RepID=C5BAH3_EDWI9|nr:hypothetical protein [Edwardsiella ictaluri]ACR69943.1 hypothetical protein NT01EI_2776 [Edwardsiella ictaluri 93-146]AVZ83128.1 hypothetical protein DBV23_13465 [Edwardsiella ictaluri]EKS7764250.1 hypothetical protein [Edwardsiella ictaluri]EKS7771109.1 hypothetical protein [Edwardsiella ictaluri]EKS7774201.1 hypothetical protein [Edwardsiella ictaluri]
MIIDRQIIKEVLISFGLPRAIIDEMDNYPAISMHIQDTPDVFISCHDDKLWMWSLLPFGLNKIDSPGALRIIDILSSTLNGADGAGVFMLQTDNGLELKASMTATNFNSSESVKLTIEGFIRKLQGIISEVN